MGELITMAGLDDAFINPLDELRETSLINASGSNTNHLSLAAEKHDERPQSASSLSSSGTATASSGSTEANNKS